MPRRQLTSKQPTNIDQGLAPVCPESPRLLILGSMPGQQSLQQQQYYAHPRNGFWPIISQILNYPVEQTYQQRLEMLIKEQIALWDVVSECIRPGSLDSSIQTESIRPNPLADWLTKQASVTTVCFNGAKAEQLFNRYITPDLKTLNRELVLHRLPSTSPAHASMTLAQKRQHWQRALSG